MDGVEGLQESDSGGSTERMSMPQLQNGGGMWLGEIYGKRKLKRGKREGVEYVVKETMGFGDGSGKHETGSVSLCLHKHFTDPPQPLKSAGA
ncbi:hypothetical protein KUCAC02_011829 [Chaenocephalus aceratus]|uniref:Uncharacterized protein n=1 Tax=Chaenocephalus aceratus TaxID=36190 RepID=A0ACB9WWX6_CHAAC|nr:hypothetical protein KUCAC02_011829 [Chaenocephalus aceratus]